MIILLNIDYNISLEERAGESGGERGTYSLFIFILLSKVGINLSLNKYLIILRDNFEL